MVAFKNNVLPLTDQIIISKITCSNVKLVILINMKESAIKGYATSPYTTTLTKIEFKEYNKERLVKDAIKAIESASYTLFDEDEEQAKDFDRMY